MTRERIARLLILFAFISLQLVQGLGGDPSEHGTKAEAPNSSKSTGSKVLLIFLVVAALVGFGFLAFKLWQKKKREEQHARLLRLFEEDDELEVELGLRD